MAITKLDLADAQFVGYYHGKHQSLLDMVVAMALTKEEWDRWKEEYTPTYLHDSEIAEIDSYFYEQENHSI